MLIEFLRCKLILLLKLGLVSVDSIRIEYLVICDIVDVPGRQRHFLLSLASRLCPQQVVVELLAELAH